MNLSFAAAALVFCSVGAAALPAAAEEPAPRARSRCTTCGVVEAIRRIDHGGSTPASFEFTVRLRDGSTRTSTTASASNWRSGDRIMLIGGASVSKL